MQKPKSHWRDWRKSLQADGRTRLFGLFVIVFGLIFGLASQASAARLTEVLDAVDGEKMPLDIAFSVDFTQVHEWSKITRERNTNKNGVSLVIFQNEFSHKSVDNIINLNGKIGMYRDLEFHFTLPIHAKDTRTGKMSEHWLDKYWSSVYRWNGMSATDTLASQPYWNLTGGPSLIADRVFGYTYWESVHKGFGDMLMGFSYAPLNNERDKTLPSLVFTLDMKLPTGEEATPKMEQAASNSMKGTGKDIGVGDKLFSLLFNVAISKRFSIADPYFKIGYTLPIPTGGLIEDPRHEGEFILGTELVAFEQGFKGNKGEIKEPKYKVAFDIQARAQLFSKGQAFNAIADPLAWRKGQNNSVDPFAEYWPDDVNRTDPTGAPVVYYNYGGQAPAYELPTEDASAYIEGTIGFYAIIYKYLLLSADFSFGHHTEHFLSLPNALYYGDLRPSDQDGYNTQINEAGARVRKEQSFVFSYTITLGTEL